MRVHGVVAALGNAPGHAALLAILDLAFHRSLGRLVEQGTFVVRHHQVRHQVLEHRAAPRQQHRRSPRGSKQATEREPSLLRQLALCDGHETAEASFRRQQVVEARVQSLFLKVVTDRQQMARTIVQEVVVDERELTGQLREALELPDSFLRVALRIHVGGQRRFGDFAQG